MSTARTLTTAEDLLTMPDDGNRYELIEGEIHKMPPAGFRHGAIGMKLGGALVNHVQSNNLGVIVGPDTGFIISSEPDTVRVPDIAFVRQDRISEECLPQGFWPGPPDLAVEVISPPDTYSEVEEKVGQWLDAGTRMVIVIDPRTKRVIMHSSPDRAVRLDEAGVIDCGEVVTGFSYPVAELFR